MRPGQFEASLEDAKLYPQLWRLFLGLLLIAFIFVSASAMLVGAVVAIGGQIDPMFTVATTAALTRLQAAAQGYGGLDTPLAVFLLLITFIGLFLGAIIAAAALHFRGPESLFGPAREWFGGFATTLAVLAPIYLLLVGAGFFLESPEPNLGLQSWVKFLPLALPLIFVQTASEELLFRGYIMQQLAARFRARWIWMGLPAVIFAALHWSPASGVATPFILLSALVFGLIAADLTVQTGNLGAAMGFHFGNNVFGMLGVAMGDSLTGLALYISPVAEEAASAQTLGMGLGIVVQLAVWQIARRILVR